jgi:hypothetical protein
MSDLSVAQAIEAIYGSLQADNLDLPIHITALKAAMSAEGVKEAVFDPKRLAKSNRQGRKLMQSYFRQKGVAVAFAE